MARVCTICKHSERDSIDRALVDREPLRNIAERFSVSATALHRHKTRDLSRGLVRAAERRETVRDRNLLGRVRGLVERAHGILAQAEARGDHRTALMAIREARSTLELLGKITGELTPQLPDRPRVPMFILPPGTHVAVTLDTDADTSTCQQIESGS